MKIFTNALIKGILIGSSLGVFASILGLYTNIVKASILGAFGGFLAGVTIIILQYIKKYTRTAQKKQ